MDSSPSETTASEANSPPVQPPAPQPRLPRWETLAAAVIIAAFAIINFHNLHQYGMSWDEPAGMFRGQDMANIISHVFRGTPYDTDYFSHSRFHPTFYAWLNYLLSGALVQHGMEPIAAGHVLNLIVATFGLAVIYAFATRLFSPRIGLFATLFLALYPRFIAHAHFNSKDMPVMVFAMFALYLIYLAANSRGIILWICAGVAMGVASTSKLEALMILPMSVVPAALWLFGGEFTRRKITGPLVFAGTSAATVFLLWPALWLDPRFGFSAVGFFSGEFEFFQIPYLNQFYMVGHVPWHYTAVHMFAVTPILTFVCAVFGIVALAGRLRHGDKLLETSLILSWAALPVLIRCTGLFLQYDGMRHVFIVVPALAIIAALGLDWIINQFCMIPGGRLLAAAATVGSFWWLLIQCAIGHPYQGSYLNEVIRHTFPKETLGHYFDFSSWAVPMQDGVRWLNRYAPANARIRIVQGDYPNFTIGSYSLRPDLSVGNEPGSDLIVASSLYPPPEPGYRPIFIVSCNGTPLLLIYVREGNTDWG